MKGRTTVTATAFSAVALLAVSGSLLASPVVATLFDPDPQPVNGTIATSAMSERTPGGITPIMNDLIGRGYPDTSAYYDPDGRLILPPLTAAPHDGRIYYHRGKLVPSQATPVRIIAHSHDRPAR